MRSAHLLPYEPVPVHAGLLDDGFTAQSFYKNFWLSPLKKQLIFLRLGILLTPGALNYNPHPPQSKTRKGHSLK